MAGNYTQVDFDALQGHNTFGYHSNQDMTSASSAYSGRTAETVGSGLAGTVQSAAYNVGHERDGHWQQVFDGNQRLVDNGVRALGVYGDGQDSAHGVMAQGFFNA